MQLQDQSTAISLDFQSQFSRSISFKTSGQGLQRLWVQGREGMSLQYNEPLYNEDPQLRTVFLPSVIGQCMELDPDAKHPCYNNTFPVPRHFVILGLHLYLQFTLYLKEKIKLFCTAERSKQLHDPDCFSTPYKII